MNARNTSSVSIDTLTGHRADLRWNQTKAVAVTDVASAVHVNAENDGIALFALFLPCTY